MALGWEEECKAERATWNLDSRCLGDFEGKMLCYIVFTCESSKLMSDLGTKKLKCTILCLEVIGR